MNKRGMEEETFFLIFSVLAIGIVAMAMLLNVNQAANDVNFKKQY
jgi:hypothetical protein